MSYLAKNYNRKKIAFKYGKGSYLYSIDGKKYLDFVSGIAVNSLGHAHPKLVKTIKYIHNNGYFFSSGEDTWHGLELKEINKERRCIQINYVSFKTDWPVEK